MDGHDAVRLMGIIAELERFAEEEMRCQAHFSGHFLSMHSKMSAA